MDWSMYVNILVFFLFAVLCGFFAGYFLMDSRWKGAFFKKTKPNRLDKSNVIHNQQLEALGQLSAGIAHDFNNILSIIAGYVVLLDSGTSPEKHDEYIKAIASMTEKGGKLTKQLLAFGRQKVSTETTCDLNAAIKKQMVMIRPLMGENIEINLNLCNTAQWIMADEQSIWQILMNVAINSRDAMDGFGVFEIETGVAKNGEIYLSLTDNGKGMDKETKNKVFEPFFTTKDIGEGTGLGLSTVYGIVTQLGGKVHIQSEEEKGTTILIHFHHETIEQSASRSTITESKTNKNVPEDVLKGKTILVVDDEAQLSIVLKAMLEQLGMNVLQARSGNEALAVQEDYKGHIDFLLSDVVMPEMDGTKLIELFSSLREETNIVLMTGYPMDVERRGKELSLPENIPLMHKPFSIDDLNKRLQETYCGEVVSPNTQNASIH